MSHPDIILRQFGERAGMSELAFDARGHVVFRAASGRLLGMERAAHELLIHVAHPLDYDAGDWMMRACRRAHFSRGGEWAVQPALREHNERQYLLALVRVAEIDFTETRLQQAFDYLSRWLDAVRDEV
jgi:type III secretion system chaperone SycN